MKSPREIGCSIVEWCPAARNPKNAHTFECDEATEAIEEARADGVRTMAAQLKILKGDDVIERASAIALTVLEVLIDAQKGTGE